MADPALKFQVYPPQTIPRRFPTKIAALSFVPPSGGRLTTIHFGIDRDDRGYWVLADGERLHDEPIDTFPEATMRGWLITVEDLPRVLQEYVRAYARGVGVERAFDAEGAPSGEQADRH